MSDSIDLFEFEEFIPNDLRFPNITLKTRRARRINKNAVCVYQDANKRVAAESADNISTKKSMRLSTEFNPSHRLSIRLDDQRGPLRVT